MCLKLTLGMTSSTERANTRLLVPSDAFKTNSDLKLDSNAGIGGEYKCWEYIGIEFVVGSGCVRKAQFDLQPKAKVDCLVEHSNRVNA